MATGGNPGLLPFTSDNLDLGAEWYYAPNSYASVDFFVKKVTNFIVGGTTQQTINDVIDPTTGAPAYSRSPRKSMVLRRRCVAWSWPCSTCSATLASASRPTPPSSAPTSRTTPTTSPSPSFAVTGLANSANLVAFYDKHGFQARVALNWRDEYLDHFGQQQNNSAFGAEPTFVNSSTQVDFSTSYDFLTHYGVYFEA